MVISTIEPTVDRNGRTFRIRAENGIIVLSSPGVGGFRGRNVVSTIGTCRTQIVLTLDVSVAYRFDSEPRFGLRVCVYGISVFLPKKQRRTKIPYGLFLRGTVNAFDLSSKKNHGDRTSGVPYGSSFRLNDLESARHRAWALYATCARFAFPDGVGRWRLTDLSDGQNVT